MPVATARREDRIIEIFLSAYDGGSWKDADVVPVERIMDGAVEVVATRKPDGLKLAIEHTIIEPFVGEKGDLAQFWPRFEKLNDEKSFEVPDRITRVFVPVGILDGQKPAARDAIVEGIAAWLTTNIRGLPEGWSKSCFDVAIPNKLALRVELNVEIVPTPDFTSFRIARQQVSVDLDKVVEKALLKKLRKLIAAQAGRRILMLEREHMNLLPEQIIAEIERLRPRFPDFVKVDEIWMVETIFWERDGVVFFFRYDPKGKTLAEIGYWEGKVHIQWDHASPTMAPREVRR
jgi:hypothetical protein